MKINRGELFKSITYGGAALVVAGYLRSAIEGILSPLDMGLMIGGGALLVIAAAFNLGAIGRFFARRSSRLGANTLVMAVAVLAILTALNILGFRHDKRFDMTSGKLYSLSQESRKIAGDLKTDVNFIYFSNQANPTIDQLMAEYRSQNLRIHYQRVDPVAHPDQAKQYNVRSMGEMVAVSGARTIHLQGTAEEDITNALIQLTHNTVKTVCFVEGHGEKSVDGSGADGYSDVKDELTKESYKVTSVNLVSSNGVPTACTVLVVAGPTQALFPQETTMVEKYLDDGGKALILADPETKTGLDPLFQAWNIDVGDDIVIDASGVGRLFGTGPAVPLVHDYGDSPITEGFQGSFSFFPLARTVNIANPAKNTDNEVKLLMTSAASWATPKITGRTVSFNPKVDTKGPLSLGVTADRKVGDKEARLVVIGNSAFATNRWVGLQRNGDLFFNSVNWLSREEGLISIRPKSATNRRVTMTESQQRMLMWFSLGVLPGLIVICGIWIWWKRR
jgi:gliding motility-associatede transport system auxiliary component